MRILEVRDSFVKFEANKDIALSSFIEIKDNSKSYIAQIVQVKRSSEYNIAYAKILFIYDGDLQNYDGTLPSKEADIYEFSFKLLSNSFEYKTPVISGSFIGEGSNINLDKECFNKKTLISCESDANKQIIISNLSKQFETSLIIDFSGSFEGKKFVAGKDFKLPLNTESLEFIFEDCLGDATSDSKSLIKEIFQDLADYSQTVSFLPFSALKTIVDDMVDKSHVFKLLVLKNKLAKFDKLGYFATTKNEAENIANILSNKETIIDLSKLDATFQNRYLSVIFNTLLKQNLKPQIFVEAANNINKKNLKEIITGNLSTTIYTNSKFKYINELKTMFSNFLIEPSFINNETFKTYSTFLNSMQKDTYLVIGEGTNYIPFVSTIQELQNFEPTQNLSESAISEIEEKTQDDIENNNTENDLEEIVVELEENENIETQNNYSESIEAIEKKSEILIDKISDEVLTAENQTDINLFEEEAEDTEDTVTENINLDESVAIPEEVLYNNDVLNNSQTIEQEEFLEEEPSGLEQIDEPETEQLVEEVFDIETDIERTEEPVENNIEEFHTQIDELQAIDIPEEISEYTDKIDDIDLTENEVIMETETSILEESSESEVELDSAKMREYSETMDSLQDISTILPSKENNEDFDELIELDDSEITDADIIIDIEDDNTEDVDSEALDKAIVEDVDKVFTTMKEDSISDSDLDFIDELNGTTETEEVILSEGMEELTEFVDEEEPDDDFLETLEEVNDFVQEEEEEKEILQTKNSSTPIVPVYGAEIPTEDLVLSDSIEQGDNVVHAKYGNGVVEKMIKYGTKTLYSINFDNVGRRLLDPTLTEVKKA